MLSNGKIQWKQTATFLHCSVEFPVKMSGSSNERSFTEEEEKLIENLFYERQTFFLSLDKELRQVVKDFLKQHTRKLE
jgi:hypothetical protein